ncbi:methyltransferase [Enterovibrio makurazakiensis]|uniref:methyltransferase n=1 Tax=Enterovibrio makurazakiensis TaxID=2910232 RepID=UPI003D1D1ECE
MSQPLPVLTERFSSIDSWLQSHTSLWQGMPFDYLDLPWRETHPELCHWLDAQSLETLQKYKENPRCLADAIAAYLPDTKKMLALCAINSADSSDADIPCDNHLATGIPGRKWEQISAFNRVMPMSSGDHWLEWCAGKGYLGRVISASRQARVTSLEWQSALCQDGQDYADKQGLPMHFVQGDAFASDSELLVRDCDHAIALHACGDLHVTLLQHSVSAKPKSVSVSPCCYHLIRDSHYQALSSAGKQSPLELSRHDLKLPLQETVTAGQTVKNKRFVEVSFRLGFDCLQRALGVSDHYLPVPNVQKSLLNEGFEAFCLWAAKQKNIVLPDDVDFTHYLKRGESRFLTVEKMETVRTLFRRPLEMWLVLDKAMYMSENGFDVDIYTFCARELTPRNILIQAIRKG